MGVIKEVKFNDGQEANFDDIVELQRFMRSALFDGVLANLARLTDTDFGGSSGLLGGAYLSILGNAAAPSITGSSLVVTIGGGMVGQLGSGGVIAANQGDDVDFIWHYLSAARGDTMSYASAAAHATNARWDILQAKIDHVDDGSATRHFEDTGPAYTKTSQPFNRRRSTRFTASVKKGVEDGSEAVPSPDAGYVKLFAWRIPATATAIAAADFRDFRMPLGFRAIDVLASEVPRTTGWTTNSDGQITADGAGARTFNVDPLRGGAPWRTGRLLAVGLTSDVVAGSGASAVLNQVNYANTPASGVTAKATLTSDLITAAGGARFRGKVLTDQALWLDGTNAPTVQGAADFVPLGAPTTITTLRKMILTVTSGATHADKFLMARFYVAGM